METRNKYLIELPAGSRVNAQGLEIDLERQADTKSPVEPFTIPSEARMVSFDDMGTWCYQYPSKGQGPPEGFRDMVQDVNKFVDFANIKSKRDPRRFKVLLPGVRIFPRPRTYVEGGVRD